MLLMIRLSDHSILLLGHDVSLDYRDLVNRPVLSPSLDQAHPLYNPHSSLYSAEDSMLSVQPRCWCERKEKLTGVSSQSTYVYASSHLTAIRIWSAVRHAQDARSRVFQGRHNLILKLFSIYRSSTTTSTSRISTLYHETGDNAVENNAVVIAFLCQSCEVAASLGRVLLVELDRDGALWRTY
jgi:hypothetical protein